MTNVNEIWIPALNWENIYEVSNLGRVRRCIDNFIYKPRLMSSGYHYIGLRKKPGGKTKNVSLHRLVLSSFTGLQEGKDVNHKDGNKHNNRLNNLEWVTPSENSLHAHRTGAYAKRTPDPGMDAPIDWLLEIDIDIDLGALQKNDDTSKDNDQSSGS